MTDKPNFVLVPDVAPRDASPQPASADGPPQPSPSGGMLARLRAAAANAVTAATSTGVAVLSALGHAEPPDDTGPPRRPRLVFAVDATASREPAWAAARQVTDALVKAIPGSLDVALAVHGGTRVHTFTEFTDSAVRLRDRAAGVECHAGLTRLLPILSASLKRQGVKVVVYIGDVFEENMAEGRRLADAMGARSIRLFVLHDTADQSARRDAELFWDLAKRTGGCVLPFDAGAPDRLRDLLSAVAVYAVGGEKLLRAQSRSSPGAMVLLKHLRG